MYLLSLGLLVCCVGLQLGSTQLRQNTDPRTHLTRSDEGGQNTEPRAHLALPGEDDENVKARPNSQSPDVEKGLLARRHKRAVEGECCAWIPDPADITNRAVNRMKKVVEALNNKRLEREEGYAWWRSIFHGWGGWLLSLVGAALLIVMVIIFGVILIKILITICVKKCCAVSPLTQAIAIINSELAEEDIKERETPMALVQAP